MDLIRPKISHGVNAVLTQHGLPLPAAASRPAQGLLGEAIATAPAMGRVVGAETLHVDARSHLEHALRLDPTAVRPRVLLFHCELAESRFAEAEQIIGGLVREYPEDADHLALHAELELRLAQLPKAEELVARALAVDPEHVEARRVKSVLEVVSGEGPSSIEPGLPGQGLARFLERSPDTAQVLLTVFQNLVAHHHVAEATRLGHALLGVQPHHAALRNALIDLQIFSGPWAAPSNHWRKAGGVGLTVLAFGSFAIYVLLAALDDTLGSVFLGACLLLLAYTWSYPTWRRSWSREQGP